MQKCVMIFLGAQALASSLCRADADCPQAPQEDWLPVYEMQKKIINEYKFTIQKFGVSQKCYEIYGWGLNSTGTQWEKIEVYFDPVDGSIVKKVRKE